MNELELKKEAQKQTNNYSKTQNSPLPFSHIVNKLHFSFIYLFFFFL